MKIGVTFYCERCDGIATSRTCPHDEKQRLNISGTELRQMLNNRQSVPTEFSRPEVLAVLQDYYDSGQ